MRAYTTHSADCQKKLLDKLEMAKTVEVVAQKVTVEGVGLLRNAKLKNDMLQAEIRQLKLDMAALESCKAKYEEEVLG